MASQSEKNPLQPLKDRLVSNRRIVLVAGLSILVLGGVGLSFYGTMSDEGGDSGVAAIERPGIAPIEESNNKLMETSRLVESMRSAARDVTVGPRTQYESDEIRSLYETASHKLELARNKKPDGESARRVEARQIYARAVSNALAAAGSASENIKRRQKLIDIDKGLSELRQSLSSQSLPAPYYSLSILLSVQIEDAIRAGREDAAFSLYDRMQTINDKRDALEEVARRARIARTRAQVARGEDAAQLITSRFEAVLAATREARMSQALARLEDLEALTKRNRDSMASNELPSSVN